MATLVLGALGTLAGGPLGGALGALAGRQIDAAVIGSRTREGPRLKDLAITTSSYGQPIARQHGRMRVAGTIIWATDLTERRERTGGGKGRPSVTSYSYTTSFAVALSSRPITGLGRIWADGNLLRGAAGNLKVGGVMRVYRGHADQQRDPLIAAAQGAVCPAFRGCAYAVFEDLQLADFGNRIPALSFEVFAGSGVGLAALVEPLGRLATADAALPGLVGFEHAGGELRSTLAAIDQLFPLSCSGDGDGLAVISAVSPAGPPVELPEPLAGRGEDDFAVSGGSELRLGAATEAVPSAVRYYEPERDFQPGMQRVEGRAAQGHDSTIEFPGALSAATARARADTAARRAGARSERLRWRIAVLDPALQPGSVVRVPGKSGRWRMVEREWRERGVELALERIPIAPASAAAADAGAVQPPLDLPLVPTWLHAFELPWDGVGSDASPRVYAAPSATGPGWTGAALYREQGGTLEPIGASGRVRSIVGETLTILPPSPALRLERQAMLEIALLAPDMALDSAGPEQVASGANRLLVGDEVLQFAGAERVEDRTWRLTGLLRGRGGTEAAARRGHAVGSVAVLLDDRLLALEQAELAFGDNARLAAIGLADNETVFAPIANRGLSLRPLAPVHCQATARADGYMELSWVRRARGAWRWTDGGDVPLVEETELYRVGIGPIDRPALAWETVQDRMILSADDLALIPPGTPLWVRQVGSHALSDAAILLPAT